MSREDLLTLVLRRADSALEDARFFSADEVSQWPPDAFEALTDSRLLVSAAPSRTIICDACGDGHPEEPVVVETPNGSDRRAYIMCPEVGRVRADMSRTRRWRLSLENLAELSAEALCRDGMVSTLIDGRLWLLGVAAGPLGPDRHVLLMRGLAWRDAESIVVRHRGSGRWQPSVLIAVAGVPSEPYTRGIPICSLIDLMSLDGGNITVDQNALVSSVTDALSYAPNAFVNEGDFWRIRFEGDESFVGNVRGLHHIARLVGSPGRHFTALEMVAGSEGTEGGSQSVVDSDLRIADIGDAGPMLDEEAIRQYRTQRTEIKRRLKEGLSENERAGLESELVFIEQELDRAVGLGGRKRAAANVSERARLSVTNAISNALKKIEERNAGLAQFLRNSIRKGATFAYTPDRPVEWAVSGPLLAK